MNLLESLKDGLQPKAYTKQEMINMGADGSLNKGYLRYIPISKLDGLEPRPSNNLSGDGEYHKGVEIKTPIEVEYNKPEGTYHKDNDIYMVHGGNHRIAQAKANGQTHIIAFIQPEFGGHPSMIGDSAVRYNPDK